MRLAMVNKTLVQTRLIHDNRTGGHQGQKRKTKQSRWAKLATGGQSFQENKNDLNERLEKSLTNDWRQSKEKIRISNTLFEHGQSAVSYLGDKFKPTA